MKIIEKLNEEEFTNYCVEKLNELESETTYFGQMDEDVPYYNLKRKHLYGDEQEEHEVILYDTEYNEKTDETTYLIYDTID